MIIWSDTWIGAAAARVERYSGLSLLAIANMDAPAQTALDSHPMHGHNMATQQHHPVISAAHHISGGTTTSCKMCSEGRHQACGDVSCMGCRFQKITRYMHMNLASVAMALSLHFSSHGGIARQRG